ncbi:MAG: AAA family ATPase [Bacteroidales bacterium]|nr:AAA family ATPase [Bacteroidales bacterium]MBN2757892.1 AAA family ATPase [Bacteroidales bacterium]
MIKEHLKKSFEKNLNHNPTNNQNFLFDELSEYISDFKPNRVFLLKGYAGTGKTSSISAVVKSLAELKIKSVLLAPTGRAAKVFSNFSSFQAKTIHKKIYRQKSANDGFGVFVLDKNLHKDTWFIVDEASMISNSSFENSVFGSGKLLDDLIEYVYTGVNCSLILVGDTAQLPPVGLNISPALDKFVLEEYDLDVMEIVLNEVVRQSAESGILYNATLLRQNLLDSFNEFKVPKLSVQFNDFKRISGEDLIDEISSSYDKYGLNDVIIVNRSNKRANKYNEGIRRTVLYKEGKITVGDFLMIVKNNYFWAEALEDMEFIANGDIVEIIKIYEFHELYDFHFADVRVKFVDYENVEIDVKILLDTLDIETASLNQEDNKKLFYSVLDDYVDIKPKKKQFEKVKENKFFNALQVKFAYAITCHKAQGGQWKVVFVDQGYINDDMINIEYYRWLYTAFTRPVEKLYLVNFANKYFE